MHDYCTQNATDSELVNATDLASNAALAFPCKQNASSEACNKSDTADPTKVVMSAMADEPGAPYYTTLLSHDRRPKTSLN